jgi:type II secretory pathway component PulF
MIYCNDKWKGKKRKGEREEKERKKVREKLKDEEIEILACVTQKFHKNQSQPEASSLISPTGLTL